VSNLAFVKYSQAGTDLGSAEPCAILVFGAPEV